MVGYLPIPQTITHEGPTEAILRFSIGPTNSEDDTANQVFLHSMGATASFGQSFTPSPDRDFTIGSGPIDLVHLPSVNGCEPFTIPHNADGPFTILLDRGGCTFLQKLVHATRAGASGVIVAGLPPSSTNTDPDQEGLLRPSASGESVAHLQEVEDIGMIYVDWRTGDVLRDIFQSQSEGMSVHVEILGIDGQVSQDQQQEGYDDEMSRPGSGAGKATREGRVGIGEWAIWNLRIVDST